MDAFCASGHRWAVRLAVLGVGERWGCPTCGQDAVVVERARGLEIEFTVPQDLRVVHGVVLADGNERRREVLAAAIDASPHLCVLGHAADGIDVLELAALVRPDAVLISQRMPCLDGLSCLPLLRESAPETVLVFHAPRLELDIVQWSTARGADACIGSDVVVDVAVGTLERLLGCVSADTPVIGTVGPLRRPA